MKPNKEIFRIALPAIVSNITVPLLGLCDTTIAGHLGSERFLAAIAVGTMMINSALWCLGFLRSGTTGMTAQALGAKDTDKIHELFSKSLSIGLLMGLVLVLLQWPLAWLLLTLIEPEPAVRDLAGLYFQICIWGAPAILGTMSVSGWFLGMQTSFYPMLIAVITNIVNIIMSLLSVFALDMGFAGIAAGTCFANWFGLLLALWLARRFNQGKLPFIGWRKALRLKGSGQFFKVNVYIFLRSFFLMAVTLGMTAFGARIGSLTLAANAVMMQFFLFFSYFMDGFAFAAEALVGRGVGSKDCRLLSRTGHSLLVWGIGMTAVFTAIYAFGWRPIASLITDERAVVDTIGEFSLCLGLLPLISVASFIYDGVYIGMTQTRMMMVSTVAGAVMFYGVECLLPASADPLKANALLWVAFLAYLLARGGWLALMCPRALRNSLAGRVN